MDIAKQRLCLLVTTCLALSACNAPTNPHRSNLAAVELPKIPLVSNSIFKLGTLLDLSGPESAEGKAQARAVELAVEDLNAEFQANGSGLAIELTKCDARSDLNATYDCMMKLAEEQGIRVFIGPSGSNEVQWVVNEAKTAGVILISPASTLSSLTADDTLFRMVTTDDAQAKITADLMAAGGSTAILAIARDDPWARELRGSLELYLPLNALLSPEEYDVATTNFDVRVRSEIATRIDLEVKAKDPGRVGVYVEAFSEAQYLLSALNDIASNDPNSAFNAVKWYGSDGFAEERVILDEPGAAEFIMSKALLAPRFAVPPENQDQLAALNARISAPDSGLLAYPNASTTVYSALAYDAATLAGKMALEVSKIDESQTGNAGAHSDIGTWMTTMQNVARITEGISGNLAFNEHGDRDRGVYGLWTIKQDPDTKAYSWYVERYVPTR